MAADVFVDLMDKDPQPPILVRAMLRLLPTEDGGRRTGIRSGYRPNHNFGGPNDCQFYVGQIDIEIGDSLELGQSQEVVVRFISGPGLRDKLHVGQSWRVQEGYRLVGEATVLEVNYET